MNKIDKKKLIHLPKVFVERQLYKANTFFLLNRILFIFFNVISMIASFIVLCITTLVFSKIIWISTPSWYFIATSSVSAIIVFITSFINFFYVKEKMHKYKSQKKLIRAEIIKYESRSEEYAHVKDRDFEIFHRVALIMDWTSAKEAQDGRN